MEGILKINFKQLKCMELLFIIIEYNDIYVRHFDNNL